jgi:hypothetical protein
MEVISKLGIGAMSQDVIESVFSYSHKNSISMMLISSKNQIDYDKGYVFKTAEYRKFVQKMRRKYDNSNVYICRDHCGPGHNSVFDIKDTYRTIDCDLENKFNLIHIDFCFLKKSYSDILNESKKAIEYILHNSSKTLIEIGTDENSGAHIENTTRAEDEMKFFTSFCSPHFFVTQTGSLIKEMNQVGMFHEDYIKKLKNLTKKYNLSLKEHNADYLNLFEIKKRRGLIGAVNIAPQFGVVQTQLTISKALAYGIDFSDFLEVSYRSHKWEKWLETNNPENKLLCSLIAGHYNFSSYEYKTLYEDICQHEDFGLSVQLEMHKIYDLYMHGLSRK